MSLSRDNVSSDQLGHLGFVAVVIDDLWIMEKIDKRIALNEKKGGLVTYGRRVEAPGGGPQPAYGYSKAHRPDLKQVMLSLTQGDVANIRLWMEAQDGNSSDKASFQDTVKCVTQFMGRLKDDPDGLCFMVDAASGLTQNAKVKTNNLFNEGVWIN